MSAAAFREARERMGADVASVAAAVGLSEASYLDLEAYDDEAFLVLTLHQLDAIATRLQTSAASLLDQPRAQSPIGADELAERLRELLRRRNTSLEECEAEVGWGLDTFLDDSATLGGWTPAGLQELCRVLKVDWVRALPHRHQGADV